MSRTLILHPFIKTEHSERNIASRLEEAEGLASAIDLPVVECIAVPLQSARPSTLFGKGKVEEIAARVQADEIQLTIVDRQLSPIQQRNLEKAWNCKVIDRTALILEIFGARARTAEGKLQVELAALNYQKSRLVRSWTHLERQRGGFGFLGGPGESQIEIDRRLIRDRIARLKKELTTVTRTRELHRKKRRSVPYPLIAFVGYTNAGKSTLFNRLTGASVLAMDKLFATLDPTMRAIRLPSGTPVILSDTVGFVSELPTELIAAFRATLEEVLEADIILHIRDIAHEDSEAQKNDVESVLKKLFAEKTLPEHFMEVLNKIDLLPETPPGLAISALTGRGVNELLTALDEEVKRTFFKNAEFDIPVTDGKRIAWLHRNGQVLSETLEEDMLRMRVLLSEDNIQRFRKMDTVQ